MWMEQKTTNHGQREAGRPKQKRSRLLTGARQDDEVKQSIEQEPHLQQNFISRLQLALVLVPPPPSESDQVRDAAAHHLQREPLQARPRPRPLLPRPI
jgi:hypothetical protein